MRVCVCVFLYVGGCVCLSVGVSASNRVSMKFLIVFEPEPAWKRGCIYIVSTILYRHRRSVQIHGFISVRFFDIVMTGSYRHYFQVVWLAGNVHGLIAEV